MNIQEGWEKALKNTHIVRPRVSPLQTFEATHIPYIYLSESEVNKGDTVVRKGEVVVEKPSIVLPFNLPQLDGFEFEEEGQLYEDFLSTFFLVRGIQFPSFRFNNKTDSLEVFEGGLGKAAKHYMAILERSEDVHTGLIAGSADAWQFSVLIFVCSQVSRSADVDIRKLLEDFRKKGGWF